MPQTLAARAEGEYRNEDHRPAQLAGLDRTARQRLGNTEMSGPQIGGRGDGAEIQPAHRDVGYRIEDPTAGCERMLQDRVVATSLLTAAYNSTAAARR